MSTRVTRQSADSHVTNTTCAHVHSKMASKAYVVAMTVHELKEELKQRGLNTKGSKKDLRDRLEQVRASF